MRLLNRLGINFEALLKIASLLGFALLFFTVVESGNAQYYVHPRIVPYMKFGIAIFVIIAFFISGELFQKRRSNIKAGRYLLFIIPLTAAFILPPKAPDSGSVSISSMSTINRSAGSPFRLEPIEETQADSGEGEINAAAVNELDRSMGETENNSSRRLLIKGETIIMTDESFLPWIEELFANLNKYEGHKIQVIGFVFRDKGFGQNRFVPARFTMNCCAADMQPVGILCDYHGAGQLKKDSWVKVTGRVRKGEYNGQVMPVIVSETVESAEKPRNEIVY